MELKKASINDLQELQETCIKAYTQNFADHWIEKGLALHLDYQYSLQRLATELADPQLAYYFIKEGNNIGFIKINYRSNDQLASLDNCELDKIYILPTYAGRGIGQQAMEEIINIVQTKEKRLLFLHVIDTNINAIAFYEKLGFTFHSKTRIDAPFFREELRGLNCMILELKLK